MVPREGLEPPRLAATDFESAASTIPPPGHARPEYSGRPLAVNSADSALFLGFLGGFTKVREHMWTPGKRYCQAMLSPPRREQFFASATHRTMPTGRL